MKYELTAEGKRYAELGLPEIRLLAILKELGGEAKLSEIGKKLKEMPIALSWAKRNGWIEIKGDRVFLLKAPEKYELQEALELFARGKEIKEKFLRILISRKLVRKTVRVEIPKEITRLTSDLIKARAWEKARLRAYNVEIVGKKTFIGKKHPYRVVIDYVRDVLVSLGFVEARGPLVELNFWNCDALFMPQDHPARGIHDMFFLKKPRYGEIKEKEILSNVKQTHENGWITGSRGWRYEFDEREAKRLILRSQTTAVSARVLAKLKEGELPAKFFCIDRNFRPDVIDAKHFIEFYQCEGIVVAKEVTFRDLLGYLKELAKALGFEKVKFKPGYFPFTEPSVEGFTYIRGLGWVETLPAGILRPEVTIPLGIRYPVLAWGLGLDRLAMKMLEINDIRYIFCRDLKWLREKVVIPCLR